MIESIAIVKSAIKEFYGYAIVSLLISVIGIIGVMTYLPSPENIIVAIGFVMVILKFAYYNIRLANANRHNLDRATTQKCGFEIITSLKAA